MPDRRYGAAGALSNAMLKGNPQDGVVGAPGENQQRVSPIESVGLGCPRFDTYEIASGKGPQDDNRLGRVVGQLDRRAVGAIEAEGFRDTQLHQLALMLHNDTQLHR